MDLMVVMAMVVVSICYPRVTTHFQRTLRTRTKARVVMVPTEITVVMAVMATAVAYTKNIRVISLISVISQARTKVMAAVVPTDHLCMAKMGMVTATTNHRLIPPLRSSAILQTLRPQQTR